MKEVLDVIPISIYGSLATTGVSTFSSLMDEVDFLVVGSLVVPSDATVGLMSKGSNKVVVDQQLEVTS